MFFSLSPLRVRSAGDRSCILLFGVQALACLRSTPCPSGEINLISHHRTFAAGRGWGWGVCAFVHQRRHSCSFGVHASACLHPRRKRRQA